MIYAGYILLNRKENKQKKDTENKIVLSATTTSSSISTSTTTSTTIPTTTTTSSSTSSTTSSTTETSTSSTSQTTTSTSIKQTIATQEAANVSFMLREENGNLITSDKIPVDLISKLRVIIQINNLSSSERNLADPSEFKVTLSKANSSEKKFAPVKIVSRGSSYEESIRLGTDIFSKIKEREFFTAASYQLDLIYKGKSIGNKKIEVILSAEKQGYKSDQELQPQQQQSAPQKRH